VAHALVDVAPANEPHRVTSSQNESSPALPSRANSKAQKTCTALATTTNEKRIAFPMRKA